MTKTDALKEVEKLLSLNVPIKIEINTDGTGSNFKVSFTTNPDHVEVKRKQI